MVQRLVFWFRQCFLHSLVVSVLYCLKCIDDYRIAKRAVIRFDPEAPRVGCAELANSHSWPAPRGGTGFVVQKIGGVDAVFFRGGGREMRHRGTDDLAAVQRRHGGPDLIDIGVAGGVYPDLELPVAATPSKCATLQFFRRGKSPRPEIPQAFFSTATPVFATEMALPAPRP